MPAASEVGKRPRTALHRGGGAGGRASRRGTFDFGLRRLLRFGTRSLRTCDPDCLGRRTAQDVGRTGTSAQRGSGRLPAAPHAPSGLGGGDRLAPRSVLRATVQEPQRDLLRQSEAGDDQVSRLRFGLHRGIRTTLYVGPDVGAAPRIDGHGASPSVGKNPRNWPENTLFAAGSRLFQRRSDGLASTAETAVFDAREDFRAASEKRAQGNRPVRFGGSRRAGTRIRCEAATKR